MKSSALYTEDINWEMWVMYEPQGAMLRRAFQSPLDYVAAVLGIVKPEPTTRAVLELHKQEYMAESKHHPETLGSLIMKRMKAAFAGSTFPFRDSGRNNTTATCASGSI